LLLRKVIGWRLEGDEISTCYDIDVVYRSLNILSVYSDGPSDAVWHYLLDWNANEIRENREKKKMMLARYAGQSLLQWDDIETVEIDRYFEILREIIEQEHPIQTAQENS